MATLDPSCDVCLNLHVTKSAIVWCSECEEAICEECQQRHRIQNVTKNHKTTPIEDYQELPIYIANIKLECEDHNQKLDFFCSIHSEPCCTRCVFEKHKDCRELKPLPEVVEGVKSSAAFSDLEDRVKDMSQVIGQLIAEKLYHQSNLEVQSHTIITEVERVRKAINKHLNSIQNDLLHKIATTKGQQSENIDLLVRKLSQMKTNIAEIASGLEKTKQYASDYQTFLGIRKLIPEIENQEQDVISIESDHGMADVDLQLKMNKILDKMETNVSEFGRLEIYFSPPTKFALRKESQGQILLIPSSRCLSKLKLSKIRSFDIHKEESKRGENNFITGCDMFEDNRIVLIDKQNNRLVIHKEGFFIKQIRFEDTPLDVTIIDLNTVAVTFVEKKTISLVDVISSKILKTIFLVNKCFGICSFSGKLVVSLNYKIIKILDRSGTVESAVSKKDNATYCSVMNDKMWYAAQAKGLIYCCDLNGSVQWKFSCGKSDHPQGIAHDAFGNVFVTCENANKVIIINSNGTESRVLLTSDDGLTKPIAVHYNRKTDILLVCNKFGRCFMYKVQATN
ncbi:Hypothetical predicted protein [Mytilus galloprovincialis]|uniref:B box-type domain-containing protein n=1 Tax=Mytilus galloprovincialis TaxID=29158 RepID=A0A8B6DNX8_MYTGA|nr:Hypothetical predicted protein [Mytilus galloprovincialis]